MSLLNPRDRSLLLECLRPPPDFSFDRAIGTAYSLDLLALLTAPLAFTLFDWEEEGGEVTSDPLALLEAVRRNADRILLFCEAGQIKTPPPAQRLMAYLERCVVEVKAPRGGVFHPKLWLLRFVGEDGEVHIRLVCLSRNLTFDQSWDVVLVLDGKVVERQRAFSLNHPLAAFVKALPGLAIRPLAPLDAERCEGIASEVLRVDWTLPDGVDEVAFWPLGLDKTRQWPFVDKSDNRPILVMSPFTSPELLERLHGSRGTDVLISRPDVLAELPISTLKAFGRVYAFDAPSEDDDAALESLSAVGLSGLHAKVYVVDDGWNAHVFLGSANATNAAYATNVELLVQLSGKKSELGIEALIGKRESGQVGLLDLLQPWNGASAQPDPEEVLRRQLEDELDKLRREVASLGFAIDVGSVNDGFSMALRSNEPVPALGSASLRCWPATLKSDRAVPIPAGQPINVRHDGLTLDALSGFVVFDLSLARDGKEASLQFVCLAQLNGAPPDRLDRLLASMLKDKEQLLRLLWLLLESQGAVMSALDAEVAHGSATPWRDAPGGYPIFERVLKALATDRSRLREIGRLVDDLGRTPEGRALLPDGLVALWTAIKDLLVEKAA